MNKNEIIENVSSVTCAKSEAKDAVEMFIKTIKEALKSGDRVTISELGSFYVKFKKARKGRNPMTGEIIDIAPRKVVKFTPSPKLNDIL
ncbi:MAG: HU family DNA-binding protein [Elusimicrobia bacterium]|nr:HU family DNA-binding protein [Elusimicrobiota bacterium]